jgi:hypothetical protein
VADTKISDLTAASALAGTEEFPCSDGTATTKAATATQIKTWATTAPVFAAGTASANTAPKLTSGTLNSTPEAGAIEFLTGIPYLSPIASSRAVLQCSHLVSVASDVTGANSASVQSIFAAANDRLTVAASTTYLFDLMIQVTAGATTTTMALAFDAGTCTFTAIRYIAMGAVNVADNATGTAQSTICVNTAAATVCTATGTGAGKWLWAHGMMRINGAGTLVPQFKYSADPTGTVLIKAGSYMTLTPVGSNTVVSVGDWS